MFEYSTMDHCRCRILVAIIVLFTIVYGLENDITVMNADCCSDVRTSRNMAVYDTRCPNPTVQMECGDQGCCAATNQTSEVTEAESYRPYDCIQSDVVIEPWSLCDRIADCPLGDDELYCFKYNCATSTVTQGSSNMAPCPSSDTCYQPTGSCLSSQLCTNERAPMELCIDPCPSTCFCDVLSMVCFGDIAQGTGGDPLIHPRLFEFALLDVTGDIIVSRISNSSNDGSTIVLNPAEIIYAKTFILSSLNPQSVKFNLEIEDGAFSSNSFLLTLVIRGSTLNNITTSMFKGLTSLSLLDLDNNLIRSLSANSFADLRDLKDFSMAFNQIEVIETGSFDGLQDLRSLNLDENYIFAIDPGSFFQLIQLRILFLTSAEVEALPPDIFEGLEGLPSLHVTDFRLCCRVMSLGECVDYERGSFSSCSGLLQYQVLGVFMWILGSCAFFGNAFVLVMRLRSQRSKKKVRKTAQIQSVLITNLATADLLTGLYMLILAGADTTYGDEYFLHAATWRDGIPCKIVGVLAVLSGEASVLILALISIDRLLAIVFPFGSVHLSLASVRFWAAVIWIFSAIISILPPVITSFISEAARDYFYIYSDVCLGLPLVRSTALDIDVEEYDSETGNVAITYSAIADGRYPYYAIVIFIGLNLLCFLVILFSYTAIFVYARRTARKAGRSPERERELRLAARMALIVGTDFCCWVPIIILGILAQSGATNVSTEMYAWCVVFIMPINSAVNPFLYTLADAIVKRRGEQNSSSTPVVWKSDKPDHGSKENNLSAK